jgi:hypothetical protein
MMREAKDPLPRKEQKGRELKKAGSLFKDGYDENQ